MSTDMTAPESADGQADLEKLAAEMAGRGCLARVHTPPGGKLPYLEVRGPRPGGHAEKVYAQAGGYFR